MIQNFNFYDIYGYLFPGLILLGVLWLPFGLIEGQWPKAELLSAFVAAVVGYITGHIIQTLARNASPPMIKDSEGDKRYPSDVLLDKDDRVLSGDLKNQLAASIKEFFNIDVRVELEGKEAKELKGLSLQRRDAFFLCRDVLITTKTISYAEQLQGMYALMMGLTVAFALGASYHLGWAVSGLRREVFEDASRIGVLASLALAVLILAFQGSGKPRGAGWAIAPLMLALLASGYLGGIGKIADWNQRGQLGALTMAGIFFVLTCFAAKKYFAREFAAAIYRTFYTYEKVQAGKGTEAQ